MNSTYPTNGWKKVLLAMAVAVVAACGKQNTSTPDASKTGSFSIEFDHIVGEETLTFGALQYKNERSESFSITELRYFISNIKLYAANGAEYIVPQEESYFLIDAADRTTRFAQVAAPAGDYNKVSFIIGVDSLRSTMPPEDRKGVLSLNPGEGNAGGSMHWNWNSGYIFFKLEGQFSTNATADDNGQPFKYHIGGFGGYSTPTLNNIREVTIDLAEGGTAQVREGLRSNAHLLVDIMQVFDGSNEVSLSEHPTVMFGEFSTTIANNFPYLFWHDHTENFVKDEDEL